MKELSLVQNVLLVAFDQSGLHLTWTDQNKSRIAPETPELAQLLLQLQQAEELGLATSVGPTSLIKFEDFKAAEDAGFTLTTCWTYWSPFLLKIDRVSDIGFPTFGYRYEFLAGSKPVQLERIGYFLVRPQGGDVFRLDGRTYSLVEAMDAFNLLPAAQKTRERSWLAFASVKDFSNLVGALLDDVLQKNDVVVPSSISLRIDENQDGSVSFVPEFPDLPSEEIQAAFKRNRTAQGLYSIDRGSGARVRVVLNERQQAVVARMKKLQEMKGDMKANALSNPSQFFDGMLEDVEIPSTDLESQIRYSQRVEGVGEFKFLSSPHNPSTGGMAKLWNEPLSSQVGAQFRFVNSDGKPEILSLEDGERGELRAMVERALCDEEKSFSFKGKEISVGPQLLEALDGTPSPAGDRSKYLLIYTDDENLKSTDIETAESASRWVSASVFKRPDSLRADVSLKDHQIEGISWLQTCQKQPGRRGVLLADDMGLGKTLQMLTFIAHSIEEKVIPELSCPNGPFCPVLVVLPLILLENETWQSDMRRFFEHDGAIFQPVLSLHGSQLKRFRRERTGREIELGMPVLDISEIQRHRVVITTYDTVKNYQHSFACLKDGRPIWSMVITDEAQEYKVPNTKVSHAVKAVDGAFHIASTGTPVENRLLDLWNIFDSIQPALLGSARDFNDAFEKPIMGGPNKDVLEALKRKLLFNQANAFLLRREKTRLPGLPTKHQHQIACEMSEVEISLHQQLVQSLKQQQSNIHLSVLHDLSVLYQHPLLLVGDVEAASVEQLLSSSSKLRAVVSQLREIKANREKVLIFARHIAVQRILARVISSVFGLSVKIINGATQRADAKSSYNTQRARATRSGILEDFKSKPGFDVLVLSPFVAGVGLTVTEANHVIHYGRWWNPAVESQATDRVYRIGQEKEVHVWLPILKDPTGTISTTFDERLHTLLSARSQLARDFLCPLEDEQTNAQQLYEGLKTKGTGTAQVITFEDVANMHPLDFETLTGCLYLRQGFNVVLTAKGNDGGADLIASKDQRVTIVQVKHSRSGHPVNLNAIDDVIAAADTYSVALGISGSVALMTNSAFSREVLTRAREHGVNVVDAVGLRALLGKYSISLADVWALGRKRAGSFSEGIRLVLEDIRQQPIGTSAAGLGTI